MTQMLHKKRNICDCESAINLLGINACHVVDKSSKEIYLFVFLIFKGRAKIVKVFANVCL